MLQQDLYHAAKFFVRIRGGGGAGPGLEAGGPKAGGAAAGRPAQGASKAEAAYSPNQLALGGAGHAPQERRSSAAKISVQRMHSAPSLHAAARVSLVEAAEGHRRAAPAGGSKPLHGGGNGRTCRVAPPTRAALTRVLSPHPAAAADQRVRSGEEKPAVPTIAASAGVMLDVVEDEEGLTPAADDETQMALVQALSERDRSVLLAERMPAFYRPARLGPDASGDAHDDDDFTCGQACSNVSFLFPSFPIKDWLPSYSIKRCVACHVAAAGVQSLNAPHRSTRPIAQQPTGRPRRRHHHRPVRHPARCGGIASRARTAPRGTAHIALSRPIDRTGLAYAILAELPPIHGLYATIFPAIAYWCGASRQSSWHARLTLVGPACSGTVARR